MQISEIMSKGVRSVNINESIRRVAELMRQEDIGAVPVMDNNIPVGVVTDRDIVIRAVSNGYSGEERISTAMSGGGVVCIKEDQQVEEATKLMKDNQVSRILVVDKSDRPVGMVSLQDLAQSRSKGESAETLSQIKQ